MGNKTNPIGMRLQVNRTWDSRWYADTKDYGDLLKSAICIYALQGIVSDYRRLGVHGSLIAGQGCGLSNSYGGPDVKQARMAPQNIRCRLPQKVKY